MSSRSLCKAGFFLALGLLTGKVSLQAQPLLQYTSQVTGLSNPIDIVNAGDGSNRLFVVQRGGTIRVYNAALTYLGDFLTVTGISTAGEGGLLSMAFHPDYETNGLLYVYYTLPDNSLEIARYQVSGTNVNQADPATKQVVLNIPHPNNTNHNGGKLLFGTDGYLYLGTGDGGGAGDVPNNAQNGNSLLGKMLRLNVTTSATAPFYTIPPTNPYVADPAVADEIWALGLRNPFRWSFDRSNGDMWIADVGQGAWEEVNYRPAAGTGGVNYGWRCYEGNAAYNTAGCQPATAYTAPVFVYDHNAATGGSSITGGFVYRGAEFPGLNGWYICADFISGNQWVIAPDGTGGWITFQQTGTLPANIVAFGEAENGTLYAASLNGNTVYKVELSTVLPLNLEGFAGIYRNGTSFLEWTTSAEQSLDRFEVEYSLDGQEYRAAGTVDAANDPGGGRYQYQHIVQFDGRIFYRLRMVDIDGKYRYSNIISLTRNESGADLVYPNPIVDGQLRLWLEESYSELVIMNMNGMVLQQEELQGKTGRMVIPLHPMADGIYVLHLRGANGKTRIEKLVIQ